MFRYVVFVYSVIAISNAAKLSPYVKPSSQQSLDLNECISNKIEAAKPYLEEGIPELSIPSFKHIVIPYSVVSRSNFEYGLWNYDITGLENFNVLNVDADLKNDLIKIQIYFPYIEGEGSYGCKGTLFNMKFDGTGPINAYATQLTLNFELKTKQVKRNGQNYFQQVDRRIDITSDGILYLNMTNLYLGNPKITEIMNRVVNDNSNYMFDLLIPILNNRLDQILDKAIDKFFETYTYDELFP